MSCPTAITVLEQRINADLTQTRDTATAVRGSGCNCYWCGSEAVASQEAEHVIKTFRY